MTAEEFQDTVFGFKNKLYRLSLRLLSDTDEAADAVQEVYLKLWKMREKLHQYKSKEALAMTLTKNLCLDEIKSKKRQHVRLQEHDQLSYSQTPESITELHDAVAKVNQLIDKLPPQQKIVIQLRDIEQYDFEEIAAITSMSLNAVRANLSRARKQIREQLIQHNNYEYETY
ncbi:MAG: RNA polymerase sigma factor [Bacteroidetes bacterium]|nr:RNA polymerase sigma factor [Bacteroidota bacterium]MBU1579025.1 RNA polymerase sigma factor [Bacteroidota bacterium]MBU2466907.1 RNA polymerase sigma factor [Bacteroidota bacterium]MBU2559064.1 RNA polymerase sigma factor [Bacteroidota bacterium]